MSKKTQKRIGWGLMVAGAVIGLYVGVWACFVGGIVDVIQQARTESIVSVALSWGVFKMVLAGLLGMLVGSLPFIPGFIMVLSD